MCKFIKVSVMAADLDEVEEILINKDIILAVFFNRGNTCTFKLKEDLIRDNRNYGDTLKIACSHNYIKKELKEELA